MDMGRGPPEPRSGKGLQGRKGAPFVSGAARTKPVPVSLRAVALGLALIPPTDWWLAQIEYVRYSDTPTIPALFFHCVAFLFLLVGLNRLARRVAPGWAFSRGELLTVYSVQVLGSNLAGHDQLQILFTTLVWVRHGARTENRWNELIEPHLPPRVMPPASTVRPVLQGGYSLYENGNAWAWVPALATWVVFVIGISLTMFCLVALMRKQWDNERLAYPLSGIPLTITAEDAPVWRQTAFKVAFATAFGMQVLNLAHVLVPAVPHIDLGVKYFRSQIPPWNAAGSVPICYYPFAVGLTFLLPLELGLSCWLFFLLTKLELVGASALGYRSWDAFPYVYQQHTGAYLGYALFALWAARPHLRRAWLCVVRPGDDYDREEPLVYRVALPGLFVGLLFVIAFLVFLLRMDGWVAAAYTGLLFMIILTVTRLRAEVGLPTIELYQRGADDLLRRVFGTKALSVHDHVGFALLFFLHRTHRQFPAQHQVHTLRLANVSEVSLRGVAWVIAAATVVGTVAAFWMLLQVTYATGLGSAKFTGPARWAFGNDPWSRCANVLSVPRPGNPSMGAAYVVGGAITLLFVGLRVRFLWWPLHPAGYVVATSTALQRLWLPLFASWLTKTMLLRYGGLKAYQRALPFFVGLVYGEFTAGLLRTLIDLAFRLYLPVNSGIGGL